MEGWRYVAWTRITMALALFEHEPLARHTIYRIGGPARWFARIRDDHDVREALEFARTNKLPFFILGGGSNVLISDEGFNGLVMKMENKDFEIKGNKVIASAGALLAMVAYKASQAGLSGLEWAYGVPGVIGGAVKGNAGAFGGDMSDVVALVEAIDPVTGEIHHLGKDDLNYGYRSSIFFSKPWVITHAILQLTPSDPEACMARLQECAQAKKDSQPLGGFCAGCTFRNPLLSSLSNPSSIPLAVIRGDRVPAGYLIEQTGLKHTVVGDAMFSLKHANFIVNRGAATASDVMQLIAMAKNRVSNMFGVVLEEEIRIIGPDSSN